MMARQTIAGLTERVEKLQVKVEKLNDENLNLRSINRKLTTERDELSSEVESLREKIRTVKQSIATLAAVHFPDRQLNPVHDYSYGPTTQLLTTEPEPEEFTVLKYLNELC